MTDDPASDAPLPDDNKLTRSKQRWAQEGRFLTGRITRPDAERLPPGQHLVRDWPVLDLGVHPTVSQDRWRLHLYGAVQRPATWDWKRFMARPQSTLTSDIHCVTTWSRYDNGWAGVTTCCTRMTATPPTSRLRISRQPMR
jgi:DMSO/TMAO reductase YedYZ molybdopterin-dependent catalytic subunit